MHDTLNIYWLFIMYTYSFKSLYLTTHTNNRNSWIQDVINMFMWWFFFVHCAYSEVVIKKDTHKVFLLFAACNST